MPDHSILITARGFIKVNGVDFRGDELSASWNADNPEAPGTDPLSLKFPEDFPNVEIKDSDDNVLIASSFDNILNGVTDLPFASSAELNQFIQDHFKAPEEDGALDYLLLKDTSTGIAFRLKITDGAVVVQSVEDLE